MSVSFKKPPVVERVIGIQFAELPFYTNAHAGWFWKGFLKDSAWSQLINAPQIADRFEIFGGKKVPQQSQFQLRSTPIPERSQIVRESDDRMIQLQNTRFLLNWRKKGNLEYPDFYDLLEEFKDLYRTFEDFVKDAGVNHLDINQWEVTYVNHIPKGELWKEINDWFNLFPGLSLPKSGLTDLSLESLGANWSLNLPEEKGRLHILLRHAFTSSPRKEEIIALELTARGPASDLESFYSGVNLGHSTIVKTFEKITSRASHAVWEKG